MDLPERIRIGRQLNLRLANGYIVEEATFNGPYGAICFKTSYYYREKFYSLETKELLFSLDAVDESTVYPIDNEFMEYHTEYNQHLIINTVTFKVLNAYEYYDKYESLVLTQGDKHILSNTHTLRVAKYGEEKSELPSIEVNTVSARYDVGAFAYNSYK